MYVCFSCLFVFVFVCLFACLLVCLLVCLFDCLIVCLFDCLVVSLFECLSVCLFVCLLACLFVCLFVCVLCVCAKVSFEPYYVYSIHCILVYCTGCVIKSEIPSSIRPEPRRTNRLKEVEASEIAMKLPPCVLK